MATNYSSPLPDHRPAFPTPDIPLLLSRFGDSAEPFVSPKLLSSYRDAIATLFTPEAIQKLLDSLEEKETNWSNAWFLKLLLSARWQVPTSSRLSIMINVPESSRERKVATLLRAVGIWSREYVFANSNGEETKYTAAQKLLEWQLRGLCGAFRVPNIETDVLEYAALNEARHAVVWCCGSAWKVSILNEHGIAFSVDEIEQQIQRILKARPERKTNISVLSWRLRRPDWHARKTAYEQIPENAAPLSTLYSSLVTVALEDYQAPVDTSERLNDVRLGETSENRFADQTFEVVSYSDGEMGLTFDHTPSDCGPVMELSLILLEIMNSTAFPSSTTAPRGAELLEFQPPSQQFNKQDVPVSLVEEIPRTVRTTNIASPAPGTPRPHVANRLCDTVANLALQAALLRTAGNVPPLFQPIQFKRFHLGRCDSMIPVSNESLAFIRLVFPEHPQTVDIEEHTEELHNAFAAACKKRKEIIGNAQDGLTTKYFRQGYLAPELERMAKEMAQEAQPRGFQAVLDVFRKVSGRVVEDEDGVPTTVQFTGFTSPTDDVYAGLSNIFLPNQMVIFYLQKPNGTLTVSFSGTGVFRTELDSIVASFRDSYEVLAGIADEYVKRRTVVAPPQIS